MRYLLFLSVLLSYSAYSSDVWILRSDRSSCAHSPRSYSSFNGCDWNMPPYKYTIDRIDKMGQVHILYYKDQEGRIKGDTAVTMRRLWEGCPDGTQMIDGICKAPEVPEPNYCETPEAQNVMDNAVQACAARANENQVVVKNTAVCNHMTEQIVTECVIEDNPDAGTNPPDGGTGSSGDGSGGDNGGTDSSGGGSGGGSGGIDNPPDDGSQPSFCEEHPDLCLGWEGCPTPDAPWLCDVRPECDPSKGDICLDCDPVVDGSCSELDGVIAAIKDVKQAVRDHNKTTFDVEANTDATAKNTKAIADNTAGTNDLLKQIRDLNQSGNDILDNKMVEMMANLDGIKGQIAQGSGDIVQAIKDNPSGGGGSDLDPDNNGGTDCSLPENQDLLVCTKLTGTTPTESNDPFSDILNKDDLLRLGEDIQTLKDDINKLRHEFSQGLGDISLQESGTVPVISATFTKAGRTFTAKNDAWIENRDVIKNVVLALASLAAFSIILLRRRS